MPPGASAILPGSSSEKVSLLSFWLKFDGVMEIALAYSSQSSSDNGKPVT